MQHLSKSDYLKFRVHPAFLWYQKHSPNVLPKPTDNQKYTFQQGDEFEQYAKQLFEGGVEVAAEHYDFKEVLNQTRQLLSGEWRVVFQPGFMTDDRLYCRSDIIEKTDTGWILYEVKSSTSVKTSHLFDLAFQKKVLQQLGHTVTACRVLHINKFYKRKKVIRPESLVAIRDVSEEVAEIANKVDKEVAEAQAVIEQAEADDHPAFAGNLAEWMPIYNHIHDVADDSVLNLTSIKPSQVKEYFFAGIESLHELEPSSALNDRQKWQIRATKNGSPLIDGEKVKTFLDSLQYPLYFLDYETSAYAIPFYEGVKPYQQMPFQYSLHKLDSPQSPLEHYEYLHTEKNNPAQQLTESLLGDLGETGTVLAWFDKFEKYCNRTLADFVPEHKDRLHDINKHMKDLRIPFANFGYVDARFGGSTSIKNVLPVVVPQLSYKSLGIQEGGAAQRLWQQVVFDSVDGGEQVFNDLIEYCKLDTLAMVEIYRVLLAVAGLESVKTQSSLF